MRSIDLRDQGSYKSWFGNASFFSFACAADLARCSEQFHPVFAIKNLDESLLGKQIWERYDFGRPIRIFNISQNHNSMENPVISYITPIIHA